MESLNGLNDKANRKKFPFIVVGLSSEEASVSGGGSIHNSDSHPSSSTSLASNPKCYNDHENRTKHVPAHSSGDKHKHSQIQQSAAAAVSAKSGLTNKLPKKHTRFTATNNGAATSEPSIIQPQKPVRAPAAIRFTAGVRPEKDHSTDAPRTSPSDGGTRPPSKTSQGDVTLAPDRSKRAERVGDQEESSKRRGSDGKDFHDFHDWSVHEKFDELFATLRQREDEIFRLRAEIFGLKETITKNSAETGASKLLYQTMQKQLDTIEEKIELQESNLSHSGSIAGCCDAGIPVSRSCSEVSIADVDIDGLIRAIKQLNIRVEQGQSMELCFTSGGASFKRWDGVNLTIHRNGLLLGTGKEFMPFTSSRAKFFVQDILDGFFPNEFQTTYPQGVYIIVNDQRNVDFRGDVAFCGEGHALNEKKEDCLPKLYPGKHWTAFRQRQFSVIPVPTTPSNAVMTSGAEECSSNSKAVGSCSSLKEIVDLPTLPASYDILMAKKIKGCDDQVITVKLRNIKNGRSYKLQTSVFAKVEEVVEHLNRNVGIEADEQCVLINSLPMGILSVPSATLSDYGIERNTVLFFRVEKE